MINWLQTFGANILMGVCVLMMVGCSDKKNEEVMVGNFDTEGIRIYMVLTNDAGEDMLAKAPKKTGYYGQNVAHTFLSVPCALWKIWLDGKEVEDNDFISPEIVGNYQEQTFGKFRGFMCLQLSGRLDVAGKMEGDYVSPHIVKHEIESEALFGNDQRHELVLEFQFNYYFYRFAYKAWMDGVAVDLVYPIAWGMQPEAREDEIEIEGGLHAPVLLVNLDELYK